jgi:uncharacterized protein YjbI with pentapeptide repeats
MSWVDGFYAWLFRVQTKRPTKGERAAPEAASAVEHPPASGETNAAAAQHERPEPRSPVEHRPAPEETLYAHAPDNTISQGKQHQWLFDDGVLHWNQRRKETEFCPDFSGFNFVKQSQRSRLWGCPADLVGEERVILAGIDLRRAHLQGANLRNANLAHVNFANADLTDCDLRNAVLDGADLSRARLVNANLSGASLKGTNLAWADISQMSACEKHLREANLFGAVRRVLAPDSVFQG